MEHAASIADLVLQEIADFHVPQPHLSQVGSPLPPEWYAERLSQVRAALVEPYSIEMQDGRHPEDGARVVWVVAQFDDVLLAYDPDPEGDFVLVFRDAPQPALSPVRGDAVGCFMSR